MLLVHGSHLEQRGSMTGFINLWHLWCLEANLSSEFKEKKKCKKKKNHKTHNEITPKVIIISLLWREFITKRPIELQSVSTNRQPSILPRPTINEKFLFCCLIGGPAGRHKSPFPPSLHLAPGSSLPMGAPCKRTFLYLLKIDCSLSLYICFSFTQIFQLFLICGVT